MHIQSIPTELCGVYKATNIKNGKVYIGSAFCIRARWNRHCSVARRNECFLPFINALRKYSPEGFKWEVVEEVDISDLNRKTQRKEIRKRLEESEQRWLDKEQPFVSNGRGYNVSPSAYSILGMKRTGKAAKGVLGPHRCRKGIVMGGTAAKGPKNFKTKMARFVSPNGDVFTRPLTLFCKSRGLNKGAMAAIARGKYKSGNGYSDYYKGWTVSYVE